MGHYLHTGNTKFFLQARQYQEYMNPWETSAAQENCLYQIPSVNALYSKHCNSWGFRVIEQQGYNYWYLLLCFIWVSLPCHWIVQACYHGICQVIIFLAPLGRQSLWKRLQNVMDSQPDDVQAVGGYISLQVSLVLTFTPCCGSFVHPFILARFPGNDGLILQDNTHRQSCMNDTKPVPGIHNWSPFSLD